MQNGGPRNPVTRRGAVRALLALAAIMVVSVAVIDLGLPAAQSVWANIVMPLAHGFAYQLDGRD